LILNDDFSPSEDLKQEITKHAKSMIAAYKVPKTLDFIEDDEMPRTGTGKILHRKLREKYGKWSDHK
jgi:acyl-coenzyme A synthetase/AMP-(fatty) acid ligase